MKIKRILLIVLILIVSPLLKGGIATTKHNLSTTGPGTFKTTQTTEMCVFCHTPHNSTSLTPLWNRNQSIGYTLYTSSTLVSSLGQPDGASKLCLTCHDGTIALGEIVNPNTTFAMSGTPDGKIPVSSRSMIGSNLSDDHPISFIPNVSNSELQNPTNGDSVKLDPSGKLQCTTCHDPHNDNLGKFLHKTYQYSNICKTCHIKTNYSFSAHNISLKTWNNMLPDPWPNSTYTTVAENSCGNCHLPHKANEPERLLSKSLEEEVCFVCHNGNVATSTKNLENVFNTKSSVHGVVSYNKIHDPTENTSTMARHVECVDCHNPHMANESNSVAPNVSGALLGVSGADINGSRVTEASFQYQVCIKCHGGNLNYNILPSATRVIDTSNIRLAINTSNESYHPIVSTGKSGNVPSLISPYTTASIIYCTDCHNSDTSVNAGGTGPNGPHGSNYNYILERNYSTLDYSPYSTAAYALCFKCHDANSILSNFSGFRQHRKHIYASITCSTCHDPHGVPSGNLDDGDHERLINFDTNIVSHPTNAGLPPKMEFTPTSGTCYVSCHGKTHNGRMYLR